ncbi:MAG: beta-propeller fold lactonase family protein, partial [Acidobacteria bacterium]|nr:beta-propeller fold lactonase family protein [Acidobacteriota bacterium]
MTLETLGATRVAVSRLFYCLACLFLLPGLQAQIATIPVGNGPVAAAVNPNTNKVYVANQGSDSVSVIDGTTNTVVSTVALSATANGVRGPRAITIDTAANLIYVADEASQDLAVIDGGT